MENNGKALSYHDVVNIVYTANSIHKITRRILKRSRQENKALDNCSKNASRECLISTLTLSLTFFHLWYWIHDNRAEVK